MLELLTGSGLAASAGLNAYVPLLVVGLLGRYSDLIELPGGWQWLSNGWVVAIIAVLLTVEVVADKVPALDSLNDVVQTVVRPTSGGLVFGAGSASQTVTVSDPSSFGDHNWAPVICGVLIALAVHTVKALARPIINTLTVGFGGPVVSTIEDATSATLSVLAVLLPILLAVLLPGLVVLMWWLLRKRRQRRRERKAELAAARAAGFRV